MDADAGMGLHDIRRDAAGVEQRIVDARIGGHMLAHVVDADIHQLDRIERRAAEMRHQKRELVGTSSEERVTQVSRPLPKGGGTG